MNILNSKLMAVLAITCLALPATGFSGEYCPHNMGGMMGGDMMDRGAMHEKLHARLKLTADQEGAWKTLTDTMMSAHARPDDTSTDWESLTTPQRADKMLERSKQHAQNMEAHVNAMKAFYAVLTPEQKKIFDDFHADRRAMMKKHMDKKGMSGTGEKDVPME